MKKYRDAVRKKHEWKLHAEQLEHCRKEADKVRDGLQVGEAHVVRDYVNHHDGEGSHVKCLIWVVQWRDETGGPLRKLKFRHFCSDKDSLSTDAYFTCDVAHFQLASDFFKKNFKKARRLAQSTHARARTHTHTHIHTGTHTHTAGLLFR